MISFTQKNSLTVHRFEILTQLKEEFELITMYVQYILIMSKIKVINPRMQKQNIGS